MQNITTIGPFGVLVRDPDFAGATENLRSVAASEARFHRGRKP